jgi:glycosyltransferase involved in cell wall biosynthesis
MVVTSESTLQDFLRRYPGLEPSRIVCIPNGYDEEDFPRGDVTLDPSFLLVHVGQLNPERSVGPLLDHLEAFLAVRPEARETFRVELIGPHYAEDEKLVRRRGFSDVVRFVPSLPPRGDPPPAEARASCSSSRRANAAD